MKANVLESVASLTFIFLAGCTKVDTTTPEATVTSLIKLYAAGDEKRLGEVVDPALASMVARGRECAAESMKSYQCTQVMLDGLRSGHYGALPDGCPVKVTDCTCGARGNAAAAKAGDFTSTALHVGLKAAKLTPESCKVSGTDEQAAETLEQVAGSFWDEACVDVSKSNSFMSVSVTCDGDSAAKLRGAIKYMGGGSSDLVFIVRKKDSAWRVVGFGAATSAALDMGIK